MRSVLVSLFLALLVVPVDAAERPPAPPVADATWAVHRGGTTHPRLLVTPRFVVGVRDEAVVECRDGATGDLRWQWQAPARLLWPDVVGEARDYRPVYSWSDLFVSSADGALHAVGLEDGRPRFAYRPSSAVVTPPVAGQDLLVVASADGALHGVESSSGTARWIARARGRPVTPPVVADGTVYVGMAPRYVYAIDAATGRRTYRTTMASGTPRYAALMAPGRMAWATSGGRLHILERATGRTATVIALHAPPLPGAALVGTRIYMGTTDGFCVAADLMTGRERWRRRVDVRRYDGMFTRTARLSSFAAGDGLVVVTSLGDGLMFGLDGATGEVRWRRPVAGDASLPPLVWGDGLFCADEAHSLVRVDGSSGRVVWATRAVSPLRTVPAVDGTGMLFFATADGYLHATRFTEF